MDNRLQGYVGDSWKMFANLTVTVGVHYVRDTGRVDSDLARIPCSAVNPGRSSECTAVLGKQLARSVFRRLPALGGPVSQPDYNFGPQLGFAWDPFRNGRTVIRGGAGVFYDNSLFSNVRLDRPGRLSQGLYSGNQRPELCGRRRGRHGGSVFSQNAGGLPTRGELN